MSHGAEIPSERASRRPPIHRMTGKADTDADTTRSSSLQHGTATCCRGCLEKWHLIPKGHALTSERGRRTSSRSYVAGLSPRNGA